MRLFTGLELQLQLRDILELFAAPLHPLARLKWSPPENLHITTKFIGEWPAERLAEVCDRMPGEQPAPEIVVSGVGFFPNHRFPKVFFAGVERSPQLLELARLTDAALQDLGIPPEKHPFRPHVTLARIPEGVRLHGLHEKLDELKPGHFGACHPAEFSVFESLAGRYTKLRSFPFQAPVR